MRVLLTTFGSRGDVQPLLALAVALRALGADARVCAPPDEEFQKLFAAAGVPLLPAFTSVRDWIAALIPKRATVKLPELAAQVMAAQYPAISAAAQGCDLMLATGLFSSVLAARAVAEKQGIRYAHAAYCPMFLPSPHQRPMEYPGHAHPPGVTDNRQCDGICSNLVGWYAVYRRTGAVHEFDVGEQRIGPELTSPEDDPTNEK